MCSVKMRAETAAVGGMWKEGTVGVCARCPDRNLGISQYHSSAICTESILPACGVEGVLHLLLHLEASEILNSGSPESTFPQPVSLYMALPPCCAFIPQG